jgi:hypothetical protein
MDLFASLVETQALALASREYTGANLGRTLNGG